MSDFIQSEILTHFKVVLDVMEMLSALVGRNI